MDLNDVRSKFLDFYKAQGHVIVPSASLLPQSDPTTLFTGSGMQPFVPYLLGKEHPEGARIANSQKCFRAMDIEEVGDNRHTTFFEMLGNWSLGDYFKKEQLPWVFEFLTKEIGLPKEKLWVTCFEGDAKLQLPRDTESAEIWKSLGMPEERILFYPSKKNWWSRAGVPEDMPSGEPGGPDSEIFYDFGTAHDPKYGAECHPNCDCGRFLEIANSVFMEYTKNPSTSSGRGSFSKLPRQNVDFGGGLERILMAKENSPDIVAVAHKPILEYLEKVSGKRYHLTTTSLQTGVCKDVVNTDTQAMRIVADHMKAAVFLIADGVRPSNTDAGYVLRRLIRRAVQYADKLGVSEAGLEQVARPVGEMYRAAYPEVAAAADTIAETIRAEEEKFRKTLAHGLKEFEKIVEKIVTQNTHPNKLEFVGVSGEDTFMIFSTYGFPLEMTKELAAERGLSVDEADFHVRMKKHQEESRAGSGQKFKGGLADSSEATTRLHTAHHLLLKALQMVLGPEVKQRGSNITAERLRIDFSHDSKMTKEQLAEVERIVNEKIAEELPMTRSVMPKEEAEKLGAEHEFGAKYPDMVSVYSLGPAGASLENPQFDKAFSIEFCCGLHAANTGELAGVVGPDGVHRDKDGKPSSSQPFKIMKEEAVAAGIRRIKAVLDK